MQLTTRSRILHIKLFHIVTNPGSVKHPQHEHPLLIGVSLRLGACLSAVWWQLSAALYDCTYVQLITYIVCCMSMMCVAQNAERFRLNV
jgi:hypothetical protein